MKWWPRSEVWLQPPATSPCRALYYGGRIHCGSQARRRLRCHAMGFICHDSPLHEIRMSWLEKNTRGCAVSGRIQSPFGVRFSLETLSKIDTESQNHMHNGALKSRRSTEHI